MNIFLELNKSRFITINNFYATISIFYDLVQLVILLYMTGGLSNPFSILIIVPTTISVTYLSRSSSQFIVACSIVCSTIIAVYHLPLPAPQGNELILPNFYEFGMWLSLTIVGGSIFLLSQAWEWGHFIHGDKGGIDTKTESVVHLAKDNELSSIYDMMGVDSYDGNEYEFTVNQIITSLEENPEYHIRKANREFLTNEQSINYLNENATEVILGANLTRNEYGHRLFADYFYFITGFHGFHVFSGVILLIIILINVIKGTYERRGHYEMVEKVGLYWHFVDLVWVFVFTFFYLV